VLFGDKKRRYSKLEKPKYLITIKISDTVQVGKLDEFNWTYRVYRDVKDKKTLISEKKWVDSNKYSNMFAIIKIAIEAEIEKNLKGEMFETLEDFKTEYKKQLAEIKNFIAPF